MFLETARTNLTGEVRYSSSACHPKNRITGCKEICLLCCDAVGNLNVRSTKPIIYNLTLKPANALYSLHHPHDNMAVINVEVRRYTYRYYIYYMRRNNSKMEL